VEQPLAYAQLLDRAGSFTLKIILLAGEDPMPPLRDVLAAAAADPPLRTLLVIGPQGGITPAEIDQSREAGMTCATLGPRILRIETAALAAAALFRSVWS